MPAGDIREGCSTSWGERGRAQITQDLQRCEKGYGEFRYRVVVRAPTSFEGSRTPALKTSLALGSALEMLPFGTGPGTYSWVAMFGKSVE